MLFTGWEVRIVKNCDRGLENAAWGRTPRAAFSSPRSQFFTTRADPKPVNNLFIFFQALKRKNPHGKKTHASVTVTVVRDRKIRTVLRPNQIVGFVTVPAWKKNKCTYFFPSGHGSVLTKRMNFAHPMLLTASVSDITLVVNLNRFFRSQKAVKLHSCFVQSSAMSNGEYSLYLGVWTLV